MLVGNYVTIENDGHGNTLHLFVDSPRERECAFGHMRRAKLDALPVRHWDGQCWQETGEALTLFRGLVSTGSGKAQK